MCPVTLSDKINSLETQFLEKDFENFSHFIQVTEIFHDVDQNGNPGF